MTISFNPTTFVQGGLIDDVDVEFAEVQFCQYDYNGASEPVLALGIKMRTQDPDNPSQTKDFDQYYSAGGLDVFQPSSDGYSIEPVGGKTALNSNTNVAKFFESLLVASNGQLADVLNSGSVQGLIGLKCHVARVAQPKRSGIVRTGKNAEREPTILLVNRIIALPGQAAPATPAPTKLGQAKPATPAKPAGAAPAKVGMAKPAAAPVAAPATPAASNGAGVDELAQATLIEILSVAGGSLAKKDIPPKAFQSETLKGNPLKSKVVPRMFSDEFLSSTEGITYDGATVSLA